MIPVDRPFSEFPAPSSPPVHLPHTIGTATHSWLDSFGDESFRGDSQVPHTPNGRFRIEAVRIPRPDLGCFDGLGRISAEAPFPAPTFSSTGQLASKFPGISAISLDDLYRRDRAAGETLLREYFPRYAKSFPDPDEVLDIATVQNIVSDPHNTWDILVFRRGEQIVAGYHILLGHLGDKLISLGDYLWVDPEYRKQGLAEAIYRDTVDARRSIGAVAHFGEINDPNLMTPEQLTLDAESGVSAQARVRFWARMGREVCDAPWVQPALRADASEVEYLMLSMHALSDEAPRTLSASEYLRIWRVFYSPLQSNGVLERGFRRLVALLDGQDSISLLPISTPRSFIVRKENSAPNAEGGATFPPGWGSL